MELVITLFLFTALVATAVAIAVIQHLFAIIMLSGVFSLLSALLFVTMDAVDVAFTEAAVGAGISTIIMLGTIALTKRSETDQKAGPMPLIVVCITAAVLIYGTLDMPNFGASNAPAQTHVGEQYLVRTPKDIDIPNVVTAILASYRGFDTLGEVVVIFTAGLGVILLLAGRRRTPKVITKRTKGAKDG